MSGVLQGVGQGERSGLQISVDMIYCRGYWALANATTAVVRHIIFSWDDDTAPVVGDILSTTGSPLVSHLQINESSKYHVWFDNVYDLNTSVTNVPFKWYHKFKTPHILKYTGSGVGTSIKGAFYELVVSDNAVNLPQVNRSFRFRYTDA